MKAVAVGEGIWAVGSGKAIKGDEQESRWGGFAAMQTFSATAVMDRKGLLGVAEPPVSPAIRGSVLEIRDCA